MSRTLERQTSTGFNGAAGDPCGVTLMELPIGRIAIELQWSRRRSLRSYDVSYGNTRIPISASMEPQAIPAELRESEVEIVFEELLQWSRRRSLRSYNCYSVITLNGRGLQWSRRRSLRSY